VGVSGPDAILALARGFQESRVLLTGAELDLFTLLSREPLSAGEIAARRGGEVRALTVVLDALAAMELLSKTGGAYRTAPEAAALSADAADSILPVLLHSTALWHRWTELTKLAGGTPLPDRRPEESLRAFIGAMHVLAMPQADRIVAATGVGGARRLLDVGAGPGTYTIAFLRAEPALSATLFDRPAVVEIARGHLERAGLAGRVALAAGNFDADELPGGHDLAWLSAIIHQNDPPANDALYGRVLRALVPGGRLVLRDFVMEPGRTRPRAGALFAVNMLVGTADGGTYTFEEIEAGLRRAGFCRVRLLAAGERMDGLVEAFRPV
jgi:SAM-dependent methyltransferase